MRKVIVFFMMLINLLLFSQDKKYAIIIKNLSIEVIGDEGICECWVKMTVNYKGGGSAEFLDYDFGRERGIITMANKTLTLYGEPKNIYIQTHTHEKRDRWPASDTCDGGSKIYPDGYITGINNSCKSGHYNHFGRNNGEFETSNEIDFDYKICPIISAENTDYEDVIGYDDPFDVTVNDDSNNYSENTYLWEYQVVDSGSDLDVRDWSIMPNETLKQKKFSIVPSSFLDSTTLYKELYLRVNACGYNEYYRRGLGSKKKYRDRIILTPVRYEIRPSAPHISLGLPEDISCYGETDGKVRLSLDRSLDDGEIVSLDLNGDAVNTGLGLDNLGKSHFDDKNSILIEGLGAGTFSVQILEPPLYTGSEDHRATFIIKEPKPVEFELEQTEVKCFGDSDGTITISATGGTGSYQYKIGDNQYKPFSNGKTHLESGLSIGRYKVTVIDSKDCIARDILWGNSGDIIGPKNEDQFIKTVDITQPDLPLSLKFDYKEKPKAFGFSDGKITAIINGGTKFSDNSYNFKWEYYNSSNATWEDWTFRDTYFDLNYDNTTKDYSITLLKAKAGDYRLTIKDANNCGISGVTVLEQPPKLSLSVKETKGILCNTTNKFSDESTEGELTATASGGVKPYKRYIWKKKNVFGTYDTIQNGLSNKLSNIGAGDYAVNVIDANGISLGTLSGTNTIKLKDSLVTLKEPKQIQIDYNKVNVLCKGAANGSINTLISGGVSPYTIRWNTSADTSGIKDLTPGQYTIEVTDYNGCKADKTITITEPEYPLEINYTDSFNPTFSGATNGWIEATVTGGTPSYTYIWKDIDGVNLNTQVTEVIGSGKFVITLNNIGAGDYNLIIEDENFTKTTNNTNCTIIDSWHSLEAPAPLSASIKMVTPISCNSTNSYGDSYSDGVLEVIATGGIRLKSTDNDSLKYYYTWKKETSPGDWTLLTTQTTNIATDLDAGNYAVNIEDANGIVLGVYENNVLVNTTDVTLPFEEPELLALTFEKQDVYCYSGSDGWAKAIIIGGTPPYDITWSNEDKTEQISNLSAGTYTISVSDNFGCQLEESITINQPEDPLEINYTAFATPSVGGAFDGWIEAHVSGGTDLTDGSYTYYWQDENGSILNGQTVTSTVSGVFQIRLEHIPKGHYYLTIEDANMLIATTEDGCAVLDSEFVLYDPIAATISVHTPISCNATNAFNNPFADGALQVTVTGGLPFASGQPYTYFWKKENTSGGFSNLNQNSNSATGLSYGNFALNVADSRGVVIGVYNSLTLIEATDATFVFEEPELLEATTTHTNISCEAGNNASASVEITGGIPPYDIQWSNGDRTATASNLIAGNYIVYITDARGCLVTSYVSIAQPGGIVLEVIEDTDPICYQGNDGKVGIGFSGGTPPYTYSWNTGATTTTINNLSEGTYTFQLEDGNGCKAFKTIVLEHPDKITIDLGGDITLCKGQIYSLDGSIADLKATYVWTSNTGFSATEAEVTISEAGIYEVTATSSVGCIGTDTIEVMYSDTEIDSEFLLTSQAYVDQEIIVFNVSSPLGDSTQWILPEHATTVAQEDASITLSFSEANTYEIGLITTQGDCYEERYKNIVVEDGSGLAHSDETEGLFIETFTLSPNPNTGQFELYVDLAESSTIAIRIFGTQGNFIFAQPRLQAAETYTIPVNLSLQVGTYFVVLETAKATRVKRLIVM